ncbi:hypothetical protein [Sphingobium subterraneum]|uniref:Uncharacterized protein n=1 Tax=Sphingobium subterraneum TaxID=627688 RepID=A0A841IVZ1_9SPHN|nr:hypothetical protein [Sphingobium subterraneum]MBB6122430.1 hypothetical protein [Sphingobium subterraneum]
MRMLSRFIAAATFVAACSTVAHAEDAAKSFTYDGVTYVYSTKAVGESTIVKGSISPDQRPFSLRIKGNRVSGVVGGRPVSFLVKDTAEAMKKTETQVTMR